MQNRLLVIRPVLLVSSMTDQSQHKKLKPAVKKKHLVVTINEGIEQLQEWLHGPDYRGEIPAAAANEKPTLTLTGPAARIDKVQYLQFQHDSQFVSTIHWGVIQMSWHLLQNTTSNPETSFRALLFAAWVPLPCHSLRQYPA